MQLSGIGRRLAALLIVLCWAVMPLATPVAAAETKPRTIRLAVMRFSAPAGDAQLQNLAQGVTQTLIDALSHVPNFSVVNEVWVQDILTDHGIKFAEGGNLDTAVAQKVGGWVEAQALVTGHLLRAGDQVRMTANVIDLVTGETDVERLTGPLNRVFDLMDNLSRRIITSHKVNLTPELRLRLAHSVRPTTELTAYEYYVHGKNAYQLSTPVGFSDSVDWFIKATTRDAKFAQAYAGLADTYTSWAWQQQSNSQEATAKVYFAKALEYAQKAVELGPELLETHRALAHVYQNMGKFKEAEAEIHKALAINANDAQALYHLWKLTNADDPDDPNLLSALSLDPGLIVARNDRGIAYDNKGDLDAAMREYMAVLAVAPRKANTHYNLGLIYKKRGDQDKAMAEFKLVSEITPDDPDAQYQLGLIYQARKQIPEAVAAMQKAVSLAPKYWEARRTLGGIYLDQNKFEPALAELTQALQAKDDDPEIHCLLGEAFARKGQNEAAAKAFERCLQLRPDHPDAARMRERIQQLRKRPNLPGA